MRGFFQNWHTQAHNFGLRQRRHPLAGFGIHIDDQRDWLRPNAGQTQDSHAARLDLATNGVGRIRHDTPVLWPNPRAVIGDQLGPKRQKLQRKAGLASPRGTPDQHGTP